MHEDLEPIVDSAPSPSPELGPKAGTGGGESTRERARSRKNHPLLAAVTANRMHLVDLARAYGFDKLTVRSLDPPGFGRKPE
jgi:hypothetical protein